MGMENSQKVCACAGLYAGNLKTRGGGGGAVVGYFGIATKASYQFDSAHKLKFQTLLLLEF